MWRGLIEAYRDRLPVTAATPVVTLFEGDTPLLPAPVLSARVGAEVHLKVEGANPTGSFKDRGMALAVSEALAEEVTGFHVHRGALAAVHRRPLPAVADVLAGATRIIVCEDLVDHANVAAVRTYERLGYRLRRIAAARVS